MTGTFDNWSKSEKLEKKGGHFEKTVFLPDASEKIYYKVRRYFALLQDLRHWRGMSARLSQESVRLLRILRRMRQRAVVTFSTLPVTANASTAARGSAPNRFNAHHEGFGIFSDFCVIRLALFDSHMDVWIRHCVVRLFQPTLYYAPTHRPSPLWSTVFSLIFQLYFTYPSIWLTNSLPIVCC